MRWLKDLERRYAGAREFGLEQRMQALFGVWLCARSLPIDGSRNVVAASAASLFPKEPAKRALRGVDPLLIALTARVVTAIQAAKSSFRIVLDQFLSDAPAELGSMSSAIRNAFLRRVAQAMDGNTSGTPSRLPDFGEIVRRVFDSRADLIAACDYVTMVTDFGRKPPPETVLHMSGVLPFAAVAALQEYDLAAGGYMLRACRYAGVDDRLVAQSLSFLRFQTRSDGSYGYLNPFSSDRTASAAKRDLEFQLPMTVSSLWTISEFTLESSVYPVP